MRKLPILLGLVIGFSALAHSEVPAPETASLQIANLPAVASRGLPFSTVFKGDAKFQELVAEAEKGKWQDLPLGRRVAMVGRSLIGTPYKGFTLEIDDKVEAPSVNLQGLDCWTFFEVSLGFARMLNEPREKWTPETLLKYIELDRYRNGHCDGTYVSRLHYLEEWYQDNNRRGLVQDLTSSLGGVKVPHSAEEMTVHWKSYRYMRNSSSVRAGIRQMESRVSNLAMHHIPKERVPSVESKIQSGDIIGITTHDGGKIGTSHVGLAYRTPDGVLHFMHASAPYNYGKVVLDSRLSTYLDRYRSDAGIMVARPIR